MIFGGRQILEDASFRLLKGEHIGLVGANGEGKSTLVKAIMGEIAFGGNLTLGHNTMVGYFAQNEASLLDESLTVFQTIDDIAKGEIRSKIKDIFILFSFSSF